MKEEDLVCLRSGRGLTEVWQVSVDGMSGVGGGIGGSRQVERLWYLLFIPPSGSLSESVSPKICLTNKNKLQWTIMIFWAWLQTSTT